MQKIVGSEDVGIFDPLLLIERARLFEQHIRDAHLADIVQEHASADVGYLGGGNAKAASQPEGEIGNAAAVAEGLLSRSSRARAQPSRVVS